MKKKNKQGIGSRNKHDRIIRSLEERLEHSNLDYFLDRNVTYGTKYADIGEIDLEALHWDDKKAYQLFFEAKCRLTKKSYEKAYNQLKRMKERYANPYARQFYFLAYQDKGEVYIRRMNV